MLVLPKDLRRKYIKENQASMLKILIQSIKESNLKPLASNIIILVEKKKNTFENPFIEKQVFDTMKGRLRDLPASKNDFASTRKT